MKVLMEEQGDALLMEALEKLRDIGLKDEERERVEELMKKIELGYISELTDKYKWLETELAEKRKEFEKSAFPEKNKKHEREIENLRRGISELEKEAGKVSKSMAELAGKTSSEKGELEEMVMKETGLRLNIMLENHAGQEAVEVERNGKNE
jgi:predicted RNase H-like nuclease (RuvC/YqgF family)